MPSPEKSNRNDDTLATQRVGERVSRSKPPISKGGSVTRRIVLLVTLTTLSILTSIVVLRGTLKAIGSDSTGVRTDMDVQRTSHERTSSRHDRRQDREAVRAWAQQVDRDLMQRRDYRLWMQNTQERPGPREARATWQREVDEIQKLIDEAMPLQEQLGEHGPLAEGTVLWHRWQHLKELQADAPPQ